MGSVEGLGLGLGLGLKKRKDGRTSSWGLFPGATAFRPCDITLEDHGLKAVAPGATTEQSKTVIADVSKAIRSRVLH